MAIQSQDKRTVDELLQLFHMGMKIFSHCYEDLAIIMKNSCQSNMNKNKKNRLKRKFIIDLE